MVEERSEEEKFETFKQSWAIIERLLEEPKSKDA